MGMLLGVVGTPLIGHAQTLAPLPSAATAPVTRGVSVLIVALDDAPDAAFPGNATGVAPGTPAPLAPDVPLTAITPARFEGPFSEWRAFAKKAKKPDHRFDKVPEGPSQFPLVTGGPPTVAPAPPIGAPTPALDPPTFFTPRPASPPGRALLAAVPLARALTNLGYANVQATAPDGNLLARALGEGRLLPGTLVALRDALKSLQSATKLPEALRKASLQVATNRAADAASAVGQATGYRAVVALYVGPFDGTASPYAAVLGDAARESGEPLVWSETGATEAAARDTGAATGAALLDKTLAAWVPVAASPRTLADAHIEKARAAGAAGDLARAQDEITRATTLDPTRADAYVLLGDLLAPTDLAGASAAYKKALAINGKDGATFEKVAIAYANAPVPDWPRAIENGSRALALGRDSANLRIALARAQFGRADLFRRADRVYRAEDAEAEAQTHIDRALQLSPDNPAALRLLARALLVSGRTSEAVSTLDRLAPLFPKDVELQRQYATALLTLGDRKEDTFAAYSRLWKLTANTTPSVDALTYAALVEGFDEHVFSLGKSARQLSEGVAAGSIARESAFLQLARLKSDMTDAEAAITSLRVPAGFSATAATARQFAATLLGQSLEAHQTFLDTGQDVYKTRAAALYRQAVDQLNTARNSK